MKVEVGRGMNLKNIGNGARRQFTNTTVMKPLCFTIFPT